MLRMDAFAIFAKVGELASISGAARALGIPKANVSRAVAKLESSYGVQLLDRTNRRLRLTEVGLTLRGYCLRILDEVGEAEAQLAAYRGVPAGILRLGCSAEIAQDLIYANVPDFLERYPDIDLRVRVADRLIPEPNTLDIVLHSGWLADSRLIVRKLSDIRTVLVASKNYVAKFGLPTRIEDLPGHRILGNFYHDPSAVEPGRLPARVPVLEISRGDERVVLPIWRRFVSNDHSMMRYLVQSGYAIAPIAAVRAISGLRSGELIHILPEWEIVDQATLCAVYTERAAITPKLKVFLDFMVEIVEGRRTSRSQ